MSEESKPTELDLFNFPQTQRRDLRQLANSLDGIMQKARTATSVVDRHFTTLQESRLRLGIQSKDQIIRETRAWGSSAKTGYVYEALRADVVERGGTEAEAVSLFWDWFDVNTRSSRGFQQKASMLKRGVDQLHTGTKLDTAVGVMTPAVLDQEQPEWFKGSRLSWAEYYIRVLVGEIGENSLDRLRQDKTTAHPALFSFMHEEQPDWIEEFEGKAVPLEIVRAEYQEDLRKVREGEARLRLMFGQDATMTGHVGQRIERTERWIRDNVQEIYPKVLEGFPNYFLVATALIDMTEGFRRWRLDPRVPGSLQSFLLNPDDWLSGAFVDKQHLAFSRESFALWFEHKLKKAGIVISCQDKITDEWKDFIDISMQKGPSDQEDHSKWAPLSAPGRGNAYSFFFHDLPMLTSMATNEEKLILASEIRGVRNWEDAIWWLAEVAHELSPGYIEASDQAVRSKTKEYDPMLRKVCEQVKYTRNWLSEHREWAAGDLRRKLDPGYKDEGVIAGEVIQAEDLSPTRETIQLSVLDDFDQRVAVDNSADAIPGVAEIEQETEHLIKGSLGEDWTLLWTHNKANPVGRNLHQLAGLTLAERIQSFNVLIRDCNLPQTLRGHLIIAELDGIVKNGVQGIMTGMKHQVGEIKYHKEKMADLGRLMCLVDWTEKEIIFFAEKKRDWGYGKRSGVV